MEQKIVCTFLGTSAADFSLLKKGDYSERFDKNARRASCMMIGESILIDCGMHVLDSLRIAKVDIGKITDIFVTHTHADHFNKEHAEIIAANKSTPVRLWCRQDAVFPEMQNIEVIRMEEGVYYHVSQNINAMSVYANHDEASFPNHFLFSANGKKLLYATDGAWLLARAAKILRGKKLDYYIIDATCGDYTGDRRTAEHNSIPMIRLMIPSLKQLEILREDSTVLLTHIAPSLHQPHDEIQASVLTDGITVSYDGMTIEL